MFRYDRLANTNEITDRFISSDHLEILTRFIEENKLLVAFRPAGTYTIDKIKCGAACKPHKILSKTIKPSELNITNPYLFEANVFPRDDDVKLAKSALCGLVGYRNKKNELTGVYLSSFGLARFDGCRFDVRRVENAIYDQGYIDCGSKDALVSWMLSVIEAEKYSKDLFKYFITGDYDLHEILIVRSDSELSHIPANSTEEINLLQSMSDLISRNPVGGHNRFVPDEFSPIQHGAQDNYIDYSYIEEDKERLVDRVVLPALDIAFYNGIDSSWTIISNDAPTNTESELLDACRLQVALIREYLGVWGAEIAIRWRMQTDEEIAQLLNCIGKNFKEAMEAYKD